MKKQLILNKAELCMIYLWIDLFCEGYRPQPAAIKKLNAIKQKIKEYLAPKLCEKEKKNDKS